MNRRGFLKTASVLTAGMFFPSSFSYANASSKSWFSGVRFKDGAFGVVEIKDDLSMRPLFKTDIRLHGLNISPDQKWLIAPARRPGDILFLHEFETGRLAKLKSQAGFHFYGHGVFSKDGKTYITPQNDYDNEKGVIVIHDVQNNFKTIAVYESGGIGPHEVVRCPKTNQLVIANGGILTHPETGRAKLNLADMKPNLTRLDLSSGKILSKAEPENRNHQLSLRHLTVSNEGTVYVGAQDQAGIRPTKALVYSWGLKDGPLNPLHVPSDGWGRFRGYIGSVTLDKSETVLGVSSPRGHVLALWDLAHPSHPKMLEMKDVCGLAADQNVSSFMACSGKGLIHKIALKKEVVVEKTTQHPLSFDNHSLSTV